MIDSRPTGSMAQQLAAAGKAHANLAVYEVNLGTMSGTATQAALDRTVPSLGPASPSPTTCSSCSAT